MLNPDIQFDRMNLYVIPLGAETSNISLGSLDFLGRVRLPSNLRFPSKIWEWPTGMLKGYPVVALGVQRRGVVQRQLLLPVPSIILACFSLRLPSLSPRNTNSEVFDIGRKVARREDDSCECPPRSAPSPLRQPDRNAET